MVSLITSEDNTNSKCNKILMISSKKKNWTKTHKST